MSGGSGKNMGLGKMLRIPIDIQTLQNLLEDGQVQVEEGVQLYLYNVEFSTLLQVVIEQMNERVTERIKNEQAQRPTT